MKRMVGGEESNWLVEKMVGGDYGWWRGWLEDGW